jgi:hypothetical protein
MLGMQHKSDHWLSKPNLTDETVKVARTGHPVRKTMLKKLHNSLIFSKKVAFKENSRQTTDIQQEHC